jgi:hypothetical protein
VLPGVLVPRVLGPGVDLDDRPARAVVDVAAPVAEEPGPEEVGADGLGRPGDVGAAGCETTGDAVGPVSLGLGVREGVGEPLGVGALEEGAVELGAVDEADGLGLVRLDGVRVGAEEAGVDGPADPEEADGRDDADGPDGPAVRLGRTRSGRSGASVSASRPSTRYAASSATAATASTTRIGSIPLRREVDRSAVGATGGGPGWAAGTGAATAPVPISWVASASAAAAPAGPAAAPPPARAVPARTAVAGSRSASAKA